MYPAAMTRIRPSSSRPLHKLIPQKYRGISVHFPAPPQMKSPRRETFALSAVSRSIASLNRPDRRSTAEDSEERSGAAMAATGRRSGAVMAAALLVAAAVSVFGASSAKASSTEEAFVKKTVAAHDIVIFSKSYCPYCRRAKAVFKELNKVPYVIELDQREDGQDIQDALSVVVGRRTVPQVFINGEHLGGSDDTVEAYEGGRLAKLLGIDYKEL